MFAYNPLRPYLTCNPNRVTGYCNIESTTPVREWIIIARPSPVRRLPAGHLSDHLQHEGQRIL